MKTPEIVKKDPYLKPYQQKIIRRISRWSEAEAEFRENRAGFGYAYHYYGENRLGQSVVLREWAPNAGRLYLLCDAGGWKKSDDLAFQRINSFGDWEFTAADDVLRHGSYYRLLVEWEGGSGERIPAYTKRVVQDPDTYIFSAQIWFPEEEYRWQHSLNVSSGEPLMIYEAHIGMATEEGRVGTFDEFRRSVLPRIAASGFNAIQLMALMEHPYYGSFGYQVSSFYAVSSRYGTPEDFKALVDECHRLGIRVIMDLVHSHAVKNEVEGIGLQDGSSHLYFHDGERGNHPAWDSKCFDYGRKEVINFLLSNCRFWLDEYNLDGFRFDGVTSMLYFDHGLGASFDNYDKYFGSNVDEDALLYLTLANSLVHRIRKDAVTIAEDMSGMPGIASPAEDGGCGFDYRLTMGIPDYWIKLIKSVKDEDWNVSEIWGVLNNRRFGEKHIAYSESHDQALVGDKTLIFRLIDARMYDGMCTDSASPAVERGIALIKIINLLTLSAAGEGYLNFMGNEFGHPEWIDFPRDGNGWSYHYARRQWSLADNSGLRYSRLLEFSKDMIRICGSSLNDSFAGQISINDGDMVLSYRRGELIYIVNLNPVESYTDYGIRVEAGLYSLVLNTDSVKYDGHGRVPDSLAIPTADGAADSGWLRVYLPTRTALVFRKNG